LNSNFSKIALLAVVVLLVAAWLKIAVAADWNLYGLPGIALGIASGIPLCIGNFKEQRFTSGLLAATIALVAFGVGDYQANERHRERIHTSIADDRSFIAALAEQKMMYRSPAFGSKSGTVENISDGVPMVADSRVIPDGIMKEATAEWNALPETAKRKIREQRVQVTRQSFGENLEQTSIFVPWFMKIGMMSVVGAVAFALASAPAISALKR
jgi:hypothetical protein